MYVHNDEHTMNIDNVTIYGYRRYFRVKNIDIVSILKRRYRPITNTEINVATLRVQPFRQSVRVRRTDLRNREIDGQTELS